MKGYPRLCRRCGGTGYLKDIGKECIICGGEGLIDIKEDEHMSSKKCKECPKKDECLRKQLDPYYKPDGEKCEADTDEKREPVDKD